MERGRRKDLKGRVRAKQTASQEPRTHKRTITKKKKKKQATVRARGKKDREIKRDRRKWKGD